MSMQKLLTLILFIFALPVVAQAASLDVTAKQGMVIDLETGTVLWAQNADERMPTSSMSKVLTSIVVYDAIRNGEITLETMMPVSEAAWSKGGSKMFVELGNDISVDDLLNGVVIQSGNDACIVLAEGISGSEDAFAERLNKKAREIGMKNSNFMNATGWPDENHYSTAADLALMSRYLIENYPEEYARYAVMEYEYHGIKQGNRNPLLGRSAGSDGVKTGHTEDAGYGLIGSGVRGDRRVLFVMNGWESLMDRYRQGPQVMDWAYRNFKNKELAPANATLTQIDVLYGTSNRVNIGAIKPLKMTVETGSQAPKLTYTVKGKKPLKAPIKQGDVVAKLEVSNGDKVIASQNLVALQSVEKAGFMDHIGDNLRYLVFGQ